MVVEDTAWANGIALGPDGKLYGACSGAEQIRAWDLKSFQMEVIAEGTRSNDIVVRLYELLFTPQVFLWKDLK